MELSNSTCQRGTDSELSDSLTCSLAEEKRILTYGVLIVSNLLLNFMKGGAFYLVCNNAARVLHNRMFEAILRIPVLFFDTNPSGEVLAFVRPRKASVGQMRKNPFY